MTRDCFGAPAPTAPRFAVPPGACDCHLHVLGPYGRYSLASAVISSDITIAVDPAGTLKSRVARAAMGDDVRQAAYPPFP